MKRRSPPIWSLPTVGGFEFDHADHVADRCEEFFVRDDVPHGDRREETEAVVGREVLRAVVAEVTLDEVAVVVVVGDTARNALMAVGKRFFRVVGAFAHVVLLRLLEEEHGR